MGVSVAAGVTVNVTEGVNVGAEVAIAVVSTCDVHDANRQINKHTRVFFILLSFLM